VWGHGAVCVSAGCAFLRDLREMVELLYGERDYPRGTSVSYSVRAQFFFSDALGRSVYFQ
jgi:hypothetical protein